MYPFHGIDFDVSNPYTLYVVKSFGGIIRLFILLSGSSVSMLLHTLSVFMFYVHGLL